MLKLWYQGSGEDDLEEGAREHWRTAVPFASHRQLAFRILNWSLAYIMTRDCRRGLGAENEAMRMAAVTGTGCLQGVAGYGGNPWH